jgi:hypothetical protein
MVVVGSFHDEDFALFVSFSGDGVFDGLVFGVAARADGFLAGDPANDRAVVEAVEGVGGAEREVDLQRVGAVVVGEGQAAGAEAIGGRVFGSFAVIGAAARAMPEGVHLGEFLEGGLEVIDEEEEFCGSVGSALGDEVPEAIDRALERVDGEGRIGLVGWRGCGCGFGRTARACRHRRLLSVGGLLGHFEDGVAGACGLEIAEAVFGQAQLDALDHAFPEDAIVPIAAGGACDVQPAKDVFRHFGQELDRVG